MGFIEEIKRLENTYQLTEPFIISEGTSPVIITNIPKKNSNELDEQYIRAISRYVSANTNSNYLLKTKDSVEYDEVQFKKKLSSLLENKEIKLIINLSNTYEECEVSYESLNTEKLDYSIIKELEDAFHEEGITNDKHVTETPLFDDLEVDVIQIGINAICHNIDDITKLNNVSLALINYIKMYTNYIN